MTTATIRTVPGFLRRAGVAGFAFFLIKGLLWLTAPFIFVWFS
ncbi:MAG: hypothetical protein QNI98_13260 [Woeseiaceae bacterium]|nr:hypothetical protein [Woeseiaceae bacterium]